MTDPINSSPRKTLGITGITINAIALIAPGGFAWVLFQAQAAGLQVELGSIWTGVLAAFGVALITALSLNELARRYADINMRSAYHYAEKVFREQSTHEANTWIKFVKLIIGWSAHLYYWVFPGVMVAAIGLLTDYLLRQMGYSPTALGQILLAVSFAAFIGFLALRGITGSTSSSIILNTIQWVTFTVFGILAIAFRLANPQNVSSNSWLHPEVLSIFVPVGLKSLIYQTSIAMLLMVGFESITSLGVVAANPRRDIPKAMVISLIFQGLLAYLFIYFSAELALNVNSQLDASNAPLGDLATQIGNTLLDGNGFPLMFVMAFAVLIALLGSLLTSINNGVRVSFSMTLDNDMPDLFGVINPQYATPYFIVIAVCILSSILGTMGILGGPSTFIGIILASNLGAFVLYSILCALTIRAFWNTSEFNIVRHLIIPILGIVLNLSIAISAPIVCLSAGGIPAQAAYISLLITTLWLIVSGFYYFIRAKQTNQVLES